MTVKAAGGIRQLILRQRQGAQLFSQARPDCMASTHSSGNSGLRHLGAMAVLTVEFVLAVVQADAEKGRADVNSSPQPLLSSTRHQRMSVRVPVSCGLM